MDYDDDMYVSNRKRRRAFLYGSFLLCLLGAALGSAAFGTQFWYQADVSNLDDPDLYGNFNTGLFKGKSTLMGIAVSVFTYQIVCLDGSCMFSCGSTKGAREVQLQQVLDLTLSINNTQLCIGEEETSLRQVFSRALPARGGSGDQGRSGLRRLISSHGVTIDRRGADDVTAVTDDTGSSGGHQGDKGSHDRNHAAAFDSDDDSGGAFNVLAKGDSFAAVAVKLVAAARRVERSVVPSSGDGQVIAMAWVQGAILYDVETDAGLSSTDEPQASTPAPEISGTDGLLSHGLWAGTIACLSLGLLFAVLGAIFAVVNTATTPVEAITGIPGLYIWNGMAALFELVAVICWSVQFSSHLTNNVLIVDSLGGWTTEGGEALGYSFWLVVVSVVVHIANCALIGFGTYEPKVKEKIQEPDKANNDILLY